MRNLRGLVVGFGSGRGSGFLRCDWRTEGLYCIGAGAEALLAFGFGFLADRTEDVLKRCALMDTREHGEQMKCVALAKDEARSEDCMATVKILGAYETGRRADCEIGGADVGGVRSELFKSTRLINISDEAAI